MTIIKSSPNLSPVDIYKLTMNPKTEKMQNHKGERLEIAAWALYEDVNQKSGELHEILSIKTAEGETFATNSPTFKRDFFSMMELFESMGATVPAIVIDSGCSNAGREFITCVYSD